MAMCKLYFSKPRFCIFKMKPALKLNYYKAFGVMH